MADRPAGQGGARGSSGERAPDREAMLETRGLTRRYPGAEVPALANVSLSVERREVVGVVGASGAGKSTLLRLLAGLDVPDAGSIRLAGRLVSGRGAWVPPEERPLGMLFQQGALFPNLDVAGNVEFGLRGRSRSERRRRRDEMLELVGLPGYGERRPHQLSGGERRRVALARSLAPEPDLLLLDEPFTGLDANLKSLLRSEVGRILRETGTTALVVLHDTDEALPLSDRIGVLRRGRLVQYGPPEEVYDRPRTAHIARLFGPANMLPARRRGGDVESPLGVLGSLPDVREGGELRVCYRPEELALGAAGELAVDGRVVEAGYRGDRLELTVKISWEGQEEVEVRVRQDAGTASGGRPEPGTTVSLGPKPGRGHLIRDEDEPAPAVGWGDDRTPGRPPG